jgi:hypothetical protein
MTKERATVSWRVGAGPKDFSSPGQATSPPKVMKNVVSPGNQFP